MGDIQEYLVEGETVKAQWGGEISRDGIGKDEGTFIATDRRLAYLAGGEFRDIGYDHISKIETSSDDIDPGNVLNVMKWVVGSIVVLGTISGVLRGNYVIATMGGLLILAYIWFKTQADEEIDLEELHRQEITVITDDVRESDLTFKTDEDVGPQLSRAIRQ